MGPFKASSKGVADIESFSHCEKLLPSEAQILHLGLPQTLSACTWFRGDHHSIESSLRDKVRQIVKANPWLLGRIVRHEGAYHLVYNDSNNDLDVAADEQVLVVLDPQTSITVTSPASHIARACSDGMVKDPRRENQWKIAILPSSAGTFAVVCSMSHLVADGFTFYRIYKMLMGTSKYPIEAMDAKRFHASDRLQKETFGTVAQRMLTSIGFLYHFALGLATEMAMKALFPRMTSSASQMFLVDTNAITDMKKEYQETNHGTHDVQQQQQQEVPFLSTNDILTSWFLHNCGCGFGYMLVNLRGKVKGHEDSMCGVYNGMVAFDIRKQLATADPTAVRRALLQPYKPDSSMPTQWELLTGGGHAMVSNWASVVGVEELIPSPNCEEICHFPMFEANIAMGPKAATAIVHRYGPGKIAIRTEIGRKLRLPQGGHRLQPPNFATEIQLQTD